MLPHTINEAKVLITVKAYPKPSGKYEELVCTEQAKDLHEYRQPVEHPKKARQMPEGIDKGREQQSSQVPSPRRQSSLKVSTIHKFVGKG